MAGGGGEGNPLEYTPTWIVAAVCSVIVIFSLALERALHSSGNYLKKKNQKPLFEALQKLKEELMLLGFISLLLSVFQNVIEHICIPDHLTHNFLPCNKRNQKAEIAKKHFQTYFLFGSRRSLLSEASSESHCGQGKIPLLSIEALHTLHIFIFVLGTVHVITTVLTMVLGGAKMREWKRWEDSISKGKCETDKVTQKNEIPVREHSFVRKNMFSYGKDSALLDWLHSFIKQFHPSVTRSDYCTIRLGFIMMHCKGNPEFNFHKYMMRALEDDFKKVVGISWYLWIFVVFFLLLNVDGWHTYFWLAFIPLLLLLAVGTKLEHVIMQLAQDVAKHHKTIEGDLVVQPSDDHFWLHRPQIILYLVHFILFQNAFEIAFFFWILILYGFNCCIMGQVYYIIPRLIIGVIVQLLCSYSTLPLYAIITQMGSSFKAAIFNESFQEVLVSWAKEAKERKDLKADKNSTHVDNMATIQLQEIGQKESMIEEGHSAASGKDLKAEKDSKQVDNMAAIQQQEVEQKESILEEGHAAGSGSAEL